MIPETSGILLEISKHLLDSQKEISLRLKGNCMWPVIKDRDEVTLVKHPYQDLQLGDVAVFQTSPETFHANTQFRNISAEEKKSPPGNYIGKIKQVKRGERILDLDSRSSWKRCLQLFLSPANPYGLSLPKTLLRKFRK